MPMPARASTVVRTAVTAPPALQVADWRARVVLAWGEMQHARPGRRRACANDECQLFLLDRSRGGTGRWCSMSGCGNRMKTRSHYSRIAGN
jgi:predicted RNA-binding Zn ribbon-like protein